MGLDSLTKIPFSQFWVHQLIGWSSLVGILSFLTVVFSPPRIEFFLPLIFVYAASAAVAAILTWGLRALYCAVWHRGFIIRFFFAGFGSTLAALLWQGVQIYLVSIFLDLDTARERALFASFEFFSLPLMQLWSGLYFILKYNQLFRIEKEKSLRSEALASEAQLLMLRYQLNPHFLFNTLNAISTLVLTKATDQANEMVTKLSKFLRYSLDHSPLDRVTLEHELETSKLYLDIEKVRFGEHLKLTFDIESNVEKSLVPTMLLQPIIENSIKHGISRNEAGGEISIKAARKMNSLILELTDDGPGLSDGESDGLNASLPAGVGINNIRSRLREIYADAYELVFVNSEPRGLIVRVILPYEER